MATNRRAMPSMIPHSTCHTYPRIGQSR
jgi:hypothetical protein